MKSIVLLSGGIDSIVLLSLLNQTEDELIPIMFDYGQIQFKQEKKSAESICKHLNLKLNVVKIWTLETYTNGFIPARNSILILNAVNFCGKMGAVNIYFGAIKSEENFNDCTKDYINRMNNLLSIHNVKLFAPLIDMDKIEVIKMAVKFGIDITNTWSCNFPRRNIFGGLIPCNVCSDCMIRNEVISFLNSID